MFQIAIIPNNTEANVSLSFKTQEAANAAYHLLVNTTLNEYKIEDDYGYKIFIDACSISYVLFIDIDKSQECSFDKDMAVNVARSKLQSKLESMGFAHKTDHKSRIIQ